MFKLQAGPIIHELASNYEWSREENQAGLRLGRGCIDQISNLRPILEIFQKTHNFGLPWFESGDRFSRSCSCSILHVMEKNSIYLSDNRI